MWSRNPRLGIAALAACAVLSSETIACRSPGRRYLQKEVAQSALPAETPTPEPKVQVDKLSIAGFQDNLLRECDDVEFPHLVTLPDGGVFSPIAGMQAKAKAKDPNDRDHIVLTTSCVEQFRDRTPMAFCTWGNDPQTWKHGDYKTRGRIAWYFYEEVFKSDAHMQECLSHWHGKWQALPKDSNEFSEAEADYHLRKLEKDQAKLQKLIGGSRKRWSRGVADGDE